VTELPGALAPYTRGFRVVGHVGGLRHLVDGPTAAAGYAGLDLRARCNQEGFLSMFWFDPALDNFLRPGGGSVRNLDLPSWSPWLALDLDGPGLDLDSVLKAARRLDAFLLDRYRELADDHLLRFFSGRKGYHPLLPLLHAPAASHDFPDVCRRTAARLADECGVTIDGGIYQPARLFRAPNSFHPTGEAHKRLLDHDEFMQLPAARHREMAAEPRAYEYRLPPFAPCPQMDRDWDAAAKGVAEARVTRPRDHRLVLQRATQDFIREGAETGERAVRLFRAAGNLREFGASYELIYALLREPALDAGLGEFEIERQIRCGIADADGKRGGAA